MCDACESRDHCEIPETTVIYIYIYSSVVLFICRTPLVPFSLINAIAQQYNSLHAPLDVEWPQCHAQGRTRWESGYHQVPVAYVWNKDPREDKRLLYNAALGSPEGSRSGGTLPH